MQGTLAFAAAVARKTPRKIELAICMGQGCVEN